MELVPCADVRPEHLPTESEADVERARAVAARLVEWVAAKTGWSAREVPPIHFVPGAELARKFGRTPDEFHVEALYSDRDHSIYLANRWRPDDLRDRSLLLHELVHHLQYLNHVKPLCESRSEYQAFTLQARWLSEHGVEYPLDLMDVDPRLLMMLRHCDEMSY